jgi:hypothetical protein
MIATNGLNITIIKKNNKLLKINKSGVKSNTGSAYSLDYIYNNLNSQTENKQEGNYDDEINILTARLNTTESSIIEFKNINTPQLRELTITVDDLNKIVDNNISRLVTIEEDNSTILNLDSNTVKTDLYYNISDTYSKKEINKKMGNIFATQKPLRYGYNKKEIDESVNYTLNNSFNKLFYSKGVTYSKDEINNKFSQLMNTMCNYNHNNIFYTKKETLKIINDAINIISNSVNKNDKRLVDIENIIETFIDINDTLPITMFSSYGEHNITYTYDHYDYSIFKDNNDYFTFESWIHFKLGSGLEVFLFAIYEYDESSIITEEMDNLDTGDFNNLSQKCLIHVRSNGEGSVIINNIDSVSVKTGTWSHFAIQGGLNNNTLKVFVNDTIQTINLDANIVKKNKYKLLLGAGTTNELTYTNIRVYNGLVYSGVNEYNVLTFPLLKPVSNRHVIFNYINAILYRFDNGYVDSKTYVYIIKNKHGEETIKTFPVTWLYNPGDGIGFAVNNPPLLNPNNPNVHSM